jgi:Nif-specific regulatory protein
LDDDRCSRRHCEFFYEGDQWFLRDLKSRNGTSLNDTKVHGDNPLNDGDRVRIGATMLLFTTDITTPLSDEIELDDQLGQQGETGVEAHDEDDNEPQILERKAHTGYITGSGLSGIADTTLRDAFGRLCRLSMDMVSAKDVKGLARTILDALLSTIGADIGAMLLFPDPAAENLSPDQLRIVGCEAPDNTPYQLVSHRLSRIVLRKREAVLAMDIRGTDGQDQFRTLGEIKAESVICAPIHRDELMFVLLHLYSLDATRSLDADALDFALAVADQAALALENIQSERVVDDRIAGSLHREPIVATVAGN